MALIDRIHLA